MNFNKFHRPPLGYVLESKNPVLKRELMQMKEQILRCQKCPSFKKNYRILPPWGSPDLGILIVGQSACIQCVDGGEPFYGHSGQLLDDVCDLLQIPKTRFCITNAVLHNPPLNRPSVMAEIQNCRAYVQTLINLIRPKLVCSLGRDATDIFQAGMYSSTQAMERTFRTYPYSRITGRGSRKDGEFVWFFTLHPAFVFRLGNPTLRTNYVNHLALMLKNGMEYAKIERS